MNSNVTQTQVNVLTFRLLSWIKKSAEIIRKMKGLKIVNLMVYKNSIRAFFKIADLFTGSVPPTEIALKEEVKKH